jgi:hypothetical protein
MNSCASSEEVLIAWKLNGSAIVLLCARGSRHYPNWTNPQYAQAIGRKVALGQKWKIRLNQAPSTEAHVLFSRSRAHHAPYLRWHAQVIQRLGEMREQPPEHLQRVPGRESARVLPAA